MSQTVCLRVRKYKRRPPQAEIKRTIQRLINHRRRISRRLGVRTMSKLLRLISLALLPCSFLLSGAAMAQDPITKSPAAEEDLRNNPLLTGRPLPGPPVPSFSRVGVGGGELSLSLNQAIRRALENNNDIELARDSVR